MQSDAARAFNLDEEPAALRDAYGRNLFGQGCLLARRLVERGVPFVEVTLANAGQGVFGWDTHSQNFENVKQLSGVLDPAWATLMTDLKQRGLLDSTLIVWMGEFGRTPKINPRQGPRPLADLVVDRPRRRRHQGRPGVRQDQRRRRRGRGQAGDVHRSFMATIVKALGINPSKQNNSPEGRPIRIVDKSGFPIEEVLA